MPKFKLIRRNGAIYEGLYLDAEREFSFLNQSSEPLPKFLMFSGTQVVIDFSAVKERPDLGLIRLDGCWYNFTKRKPNPEMEFAVTQILSYGSEDSE